jgi:ATP-dependent DNA helicase RecG
MRRMEVTRQNHLMPAADSTRPKKSKPAGAAQSTVSAPQRALQKMGLERDIDLALHLPMRYEDETALTTLAAGRDGQTIQFEAEVIDSEIVFRGRRQLVVQVDDGTDTCKLRFFNFYPSQQKMLAIGQRLRFRGELKKGMFGCDMMHPSFKNAAMPLAAALTPVYSTVAQLPQAYLRKAVVAGLERSIGKGLLSETLPEEILRKNGNGPAWNLASSLSFLHHPSPDVSLPTLEDKSHPAWQRLKLEELLAQALSQLQSKRERAALRSPKLQASASPTALLTRLHAALPFELTAAQRRVSEEIANDLALPNPMHRLLQGDVGSGKTVVAALAAARCIDNGWQCALMAPTEILAEQHFRKLIAWLEPLGIKVAWLTGSQGKRERTAMLALIESGEAGLVIGTHAIIQDKVQFAKLGLAIIDEQHRFGVQQRLQLRRKMEIAGAHPHLLMMSATPIPRTLAMSVYADLDVSTIDELPPGRTPIVTKVVSDARRAEVIERIRAQLSEGRQVYWVCPLIEESEALDLTNATQTHTALSEALPGISVGLLHSRVPVTEKKAVMSLFVDGVMGVLVSTTVIEVGVDVPNASLMVIEHAERFGLSQLHQLRGRVGRGAAASACVLMYGTGESGRLSDTAKARLKVMAESNDGFVIAQRDLEIRGPGEFMGAKQSGAPLLRFADLITDAPLIEWAKTAAPRMLDEHAELAERHLQRWLGGRQELLAA